MVCLAARDKPARTASAPGRCCESRTAAGRRSKRDAAGANKMATACKTDYCAYDHAGNIIGVLRDAGSAWRQIGSNDKAEAVKNSYVATQQ